SDTMDVLVEREFKLDGQTIAVLVDKFHGMLTAAAMMAEQRVGDGVENARFAAAVESGQHPQSGVAVEADLLLVLVAEETFELDTLRDHAWISFICSSARASTPARYCSSKLVNSCSRYSRTVCSKLLAGLCDPPTSVILSSVFRSMISRSYQRGKVSPSLRSISSRLSTPAV